LHYQLLLWGDGDSDNFSDLLKTRKISSVQIERNYSRHGAQSTRWRLFARTAIAESSVTVSKQTDESSAASTVHARPARRS